MREKPTLTETPEWKKRLVAGEDVHSDGFDLFSPSKLEGVFKQPNSSQLHSDRDAEPTDTDSNRKPFSLPTALPFPEQFSSYRGTRSRINLEVLQEVNEEEESQPHEFSTISSDVVKNGSLRGLVKQRVKTFERAEDILLGTSSPRAISSLHENSGSVVNDPRWRSASGLEELKNEFISPVTMSRQNSIRNTIMRSSFDVDVGTLQAKLEQAAPENDERPSSSASDSYIDFAKKQDIEQDFRDERLPDVTSQSLPDDLSMGTQDFVSNGGFINSRRGGRSNEASFLRKSLSLSQEQSRLVSNSMLDIQVNSSPPLRPRHVDESVEYSRISVSAPTSPQDTSVIHHTGNTRPTSSGSPLKLFGNRDTYTNNKLMRILSQFEDPDSSQGHLKEEKQSLNGKDEHPLRMSQFGKGDLDGFGFEQNVRKPSPMPAATVKPEDRIFPAIESDRQAIEAGAEADMTTEVAEHPPPGQEHAGQDRTTKRRKTVLREQIPLMGQELEVKISELEETATLAGTKRKDARPGEEGVPALAEVLASQDFLRPKSTRKSSLIRVSTATDIEADDVRSTVDLTNEDIAEALAAELATFAQEAVQVNNDSRKPSLATKDYMEEANKVMQFIRSRGKPNPAGTFPEITDPADVSQVNPDSILDLDLDGESTKDDFSRPPSREHTPKPVADRRHARHDSRTASYLRKYQDEDDMDALGSTSVFGTLPPANSTIAARGNNMTIPVDQESSPPNIRILTQSETMRKRKYSGSTVEQDHIQTHQTGQGSTQNSFPSQSSTAGQKGIISSGTVSIPDNVGTMTFDHEKKTWVKKMSENGHFKPKGRQHNHTLTEDDPFDSIPDLSIDEQQERQDKARKPQPTLSQVAEEDDTEPESRVKSVDVRNSASSKPAAEADGAGQFSDDEDDTEEIDRSSLRSKASEHEAKLHNGIASKPPVELKDDRKQARVVTIAFSSPVVSGVNYANLSEEDFSDLPREEDLPLDDSEIYSDEPVKGLDVQPAAEPIKSQDKNPFLVLKQGRGVAFQPRTISPIVEGDEEQPDPRMSLIHVNHSTMITPAPSKTVAKLQSTGKAASILCLTPLSDFSVHQVDKARHTDQSYVEDRKHPNALRQTHGSLALAVDELIKAITDAAPEELFWDQMRRLTLVPASLSTVHGLKEYCPVLEDLNASGNRISQLGGLPPTLRRLDLHSSMVNNLTAWSHLQNLQYLDVSGCQLETLDGFSSLVQLRRLKANNNRISNIDGVLDLDALLELELGGNKIAKVDFEDCELGRLKRLDLSNNGLETIKALDRLSALEDLDISQNLLNCLPEVSNSKGLPLQKLRISENQLDTISLKRMPALQYLDLDGNSIRDVQGLSLAYHLDFLSLREQRCQSDIVELVLATANECRHIRLSSNAVPHGTFRLPKLPQNNLRELEIAACGISELPERFGLYFPNCRYLNVNFNAIKEIGHLRKMMHLNTLLLAKNRIQRLRRTCLVLSKLPSLKQIDLRDNPLTVGFYGPSSTLPMKSSETRYDLPGGSESEDATWTKVLDEVTGLKRRTVELLLAGHCKNLTQLDGLKLQRDRLRCADETWNKLTSQGVLLKPAAEAVQGNDVTMTGEVGHGTGVLVGNDGDVFNG